MHHGVGLPLFDKRDELVIVATEGDGEQVDDPARGLSPGGDPGLQRFDRGEGLDPQLGIDPATSDLATREFV